jgi:hypothetical protein
MAQKLAVAAGGPVWDNFSLLSPERAEAQINALSATPIWSAVEWP